MNKSKYFGKSFILVDIQSDGGGRILRIGEHPGSENYFPAVGKDNDEAILGLVDTLRVTRKLLTEYIRRSSKKISSANDYKRQLDNMAKKIGESTDDVMNIESHILFHLFSEMTASRTKSK